MTTFKTALSVCGLSLQEASDFLDEPIYTVKKWSSGVLYPPRRIWRLLASLFEQIQDAADGAADVMDLEGIDLRAFNHIEADLRGNGLPTQGALAAAGAMALLMAIADQEAD